MSGGGRGVIVQNAVASFMDASFFSAIAGLYEQGTFPKGPAVSQNFSTPPFVSMISFTDDPKSSYL